MNTLAERLGFPRPNRRYILPTRFGLAYALVVFLVFLGAVNYSDNMALLLAFVLAALAWLAMIRCERSLSGLEIEIDPPPVGFVGRPLAVGVRLRGTRFRPPTLLAVAFRGGERTGVPRPAVGETQAAALSFVPTRRGRVPIPPWRLSCERPLGLFHAWRGAPSGREAIVAPAPATDGPWRPPSALPPCRDHEESEDFRELRPWRSGDPPRRIAWRVYARRRELLVRTYEPPPSPELVLRWEETDALARGTGRERKEHRLSILCRWVLEAEREGAPYGLVLPSVTIAPNRGETHLRTCLEALALHDL